MEQQDEACLDAVHVYPMFGPGHTFAQAEGMCWCHPVYERCGDVVIVIHNVMH
jgi:hypothetical protein